jgi:two-component system alkaline phosphatase synthesis response regulator PhoP
MNQALRCPKCGEPKLATASRNAEAGERVCPHCGTPLTGGSQPAATAPPTTILWIDDDRLLLSVCCEALERHGYRTLIATDGATGIEIAKTEQPDVILLDVIMPTMHGLEVCQRLRAEPNLKETPIILLTALEDEGVGAMGNKAGATTTMRKPFGPAHVVSVLEQMVGRKADPPVL